MPFSGMSRGELKLGYERAEVGQWCARDAPRTPVSFGLELAPTCDSLAYSGRSPWSPGASRAGKGVSTGVAEVKVQEGESVESALRRFKRKVQQEDIIKDIKKHSFYLKPGDKRRAKQALARKRSRKKLRRELE